MDCTGFEASARAAASTGDAREGDAVLHVIDFRARRMAVETPRRRLCRAHPELLAEAEQVRRARRADRRAAMKRADPELVANLAGKFEFAAGLLSRLCAEAAGSSVPLPDGVLDRLDAIVAELETESARLQLYAFGRDPEAA